jgi:hypothetical protein
MRRSFARVRGIGYILWHTRHMFYHMLLGMAWAWFLREMWHEFNFKWLVISVFGSVLPDFEHLVYFFTYGKKDQYTRHISDFLKKHEWRIVTVYIEQGHKHNTKLKFHNFYFMGLLLILTTICYQYDWNSSVVLFGAMSSHYIFDIFDDLVTVGHINPNWTRLG